MVSLLTRVLFSLSLKASVSQGHPQLQLTHALLLSMTSQIQCKNLTSSADLPEINTELRYKNKYIWMRQWLCLHSDSIHKSCLKSTGNQNWLSIYFLNKFCRSYCARFIIAHYSNLLSKCNNILLPLKIMFLLTEPILWGKGKIILTSQPTKPN